MKDLNGNGKLHLTKKVKNIIIFSITMLVFGLCFAVGSGKCEASEIKLRGHRGFRKQATEDMKQPYQIKTSGKTYYVSTEGSNKNKGTKTKPFRTVSYGIRRMKSGDTLLIRGGTYNETIKINEIKSGTEKGYTTIAAYGSEKVYLNGTGKEAPVMCTINGAHHIRINGLRITRAMGQDACGIRVMSGSHHIILSENIITYIEVEDPTVEDHTANGILMFGDTAAGIYDILVYKNKLYHCETGWGEVISAAGNCKYLNIVKNRVKDCGNIGIDLSGNYGYCKYAARDRARKSLIYGNYVEKCISGYATSYGIYVDGGQEIEINNNTVKGCSGGIEVGAEEVPKKKEYSTKDITVYNNRLYENKECGIAIGGYKKTLGWVLKVTVSGNLLKYNGEEDSVFTLAKCDGVLIEENTIYSNLSKEDVFYYAFDEDYVKNVILKKNILKKNILN